MVTKNETARARAVGTKQEDPETAALVEQEENKIHRRTPFIFLSMFGPRMIQLFFCFILGVVCGSLIVLRHVHSNNCDLSSYLEFFTKNSTSKQPSFTELLIASNSDKYWRHHYEHYYEEWLKPFRDVPNFTMMEIGVQRGASLGLWAEYFTYPSKIWGMAYDTEGNIQKARSKLATEYSKNKGIVDLFLGDQGNITNLQETARTKGPFDIILDDGSHLPEHMVLGLFYLWGSIKPGGLYIVEDLETNYWTPGKTLYGYKFENTGFGKGAAVEKFKQLLDLLPSRQLGVKQGSMSILPGDDDLCCVLWGKNLVAFQKCSQKQKETPPKQNQLTYDIAQAQEWLKEAKATNPKEFQ